MRKIIVTGRLAADAETKNVNGREMFEFRIANNERSKKSETGKETYWFRVACFNEGMKNFVPYLTKGKTVEVIGDLKATPYTSNASGKIEPGLEILADTIMFDDNFSSPQHADNGGSTQEEEVTKPAPTTAPKKSTRNPSTKTQTQAVTPEPTQVNDDDDDLPF